MEYGKPLSDMQFRDLEQRYINRNWAVAARFRSVDHLEGKELVQGRDNGGDYSGIWIPYYYPENPNSVTGRLRRDNPEIDGRTKKPKRKYLVAGGDRSHVYFPPHYTQEQLLNSALPILWVEGEFKAVALRRLASEGVDHPRFLVLALPGVWNFIGKIGVELNPRGERVPVKGVIPDIELVNHVNRNEAILYDCDRESKTRAEVHKARYAFSKELRSRGANVGFLEWDPDFGKGPDDWLATVGSDFVLAQIARIEYNTITGWEAKLLCTDTGKPKPLLENIRLALENSIEFLGLALDEFSEKIARPVTVPWRGSKTDEWTDADSSELAAWLQRKRIDATSALAYEGVRLVAARNAYHPVRNYLNSLVPDGEPRVDTWLTRYAGVKPSNYVAAVGRCWLISAVARIFNPGCKADSALLLIGPEGKGKSTLCRVLGDPWFSDGLPDLSDQKESASHLVGNWIVEMSELAALNKAALNLTKAFLSRAEDKYRPYYGRATTTRPRQVAFIATSNNVEPLRDTTGNRRFWPVTTGRMDTEQLAIDRDQLWAEAVALFRDGVPWWLSNENMVMEASREQAERTEQHVWYDHVVAYSSFKEHVTVADVLKDAIKKDISHQTQQDKTAISSILQAMGWQLSQRRIDGKRPKVYLNPEWLPDADTPEDETQ